MAFKFPIWGLHPNIAVIVELVNVARNRIMVGCRAVLLLTWCGDVLQVGRRSELADGFPDDTLKLSDRDLHWHLPRGSTGRRLAVPH